MLTKPKYIQDANIADNKIRYKWDEWKVEEAYKPADDELVKRLSVLSYRANAALTIAISEWVIFRFEKLFDDPMPLEYLEAAWAANVRPAYTEYIETDDDEWRGPVKGPINIALTIVIDILFCSEEILEPQKSPAWMSNLAELVLLDTRAFQQWRNICIQRLEQFFSVPEEEPDDLFGDQNTRENLVPREVFDPEVDFHPEMTRNLIRRFLMELRWEDNEFLHSPEEMLQIDGYQGTPYVLD